MSFSISRRNFLRGVGASSLLTPFAGSLSRNAYASEGNPKRLLVFFTPDGCNPNQIWPTGEERNFQFASGTTWEPLQSIKDDLIFIKGLNFYNIDNHEPGMRAMLTNCGSLSTSSLSSIDQVVADHLSTTSDNLSLRRSLELGVFADKEGGNSQTRMAYRNGQMVTPNDNPNAIFDLLFAQEYQDSGTYDKVAARRQRVVDITKGHIAALRQRLGTEEKRKLDAHTESLFELEQQLNAPEISTDIQLEHPNIASYHSNGNFSQVLRAQMDIAANAFAFDKTRVASIQVGRTVFGEQVTWLGYSDGHHDLSHAQFGTEKAQRFVNTLRWYSEQFAYLVQKLKSLPDPLVPGTSIFDNTIVVWAKELGHSTYHSCSDVPFVVSGGGAFEAGRYLDVGSKYHGSLWVSIAQAFGLEMDSFGDSGSGFGRLEML
ncbi:MAG: Tat (twin-arginine translocation) pathway signal sequence domain protein [Deltaproteobacteria bacterium]|nr:Tat (twin-arginine translocation) pathway signal sequence domain protein [Deltaproteobacteria bacterium]